MPRLKQTDWQLIKRVWPYVRDRKRLLWIVLTMIPLGVACELYQPLLLKRAIDEGILKQDMSLVLSVSLQFLVFVLIAFLAKTFGMYTLQRTGLRTLADLRSGIFGHVLKQGQGFFDKRTTGSLMTRTINDVEAIYESLAWGAVGLIGDSLMILGTLGVMLALDWKLSIVAFALSPVIIFVVNVFRKRLRVLYNEIRRSLSRLNGYFAEQIHGMQVIQLNGAEAQARFDFRRQAYSYLSAYKQANWWDAGLYAIMDGMSALAIGLMLGYGAYAMGAGTDGVTLGLLIAFIDYLTKVFVPIREFSGRLAMIQRSVAALERVFGLLDTDMQVQGGDAQLSGARHIRFDKVDFTYHPERPPVLKGIDLELQAGEVVAIVGATGSGKTTISKLLLRQYDEYSGSIRIDGREIRDYSIASMRDAIATVHQDPYLFHGTIRENITLWSSAIDESAIDNASERARARPFIEALDRQYDHVVTARGGNLSAGQRQLISLARALARPAPIVILDEATASVDSMTERLIDEAIDTLFKERTVLVIAHRISTIAKADRILVMQNGRIVQSGTHEELSKTEGHYRVLVESGFSS